MKREKSIAFFVHGLGADNDAFWGSTKRSLETDSQLSHIQVEFWGYETTIKPENIFKRIYKRRKLETLEQLGQHLWSEMSSYLASGNYDSIILFGHSLGGLVAVASVVYGLARPDNIDKIKRIKAIGLCASPLAGAKLADRFHKIARLYGKNEHIKTLRKDSNERDNIVNEFIDRVVKVTMESSQHHKIPVKLFRAANDEIVLEEELNPRDFYNEDISVLDGNHSGCVKNLDSLSHNYTFLKEWILRYIPSRMKSFEDLLSELSNEVTRLFAMWKPKAEKNTHIVKTNYLLRIFFQKLLYVCTKIDERHAQGNANLWICHSIKDEQPVQIISEEREGFFTIEQLIVTGADSIDYRDNRIEWNDKIDTNLISIAAKAIKKHETIFEEIVKTQYDSSVEKAQQTSHILGIPLIDVNNTELIKDAAPLAITIDYDFSLNPSVEEIRTIKECAEEVQKIYKKFEANWKGDLFFLRD